MTVMRELLYQWGRLRVKSGVGGGEELASGLADALNSGVKSSWKVLWN